MVMDQDGKPRYTMSYNESTLQMTVEWRPDFTMEDWEEFSTASRARLEEGVRDWSFDLRRINFINSLILGAIIGFNMVLQAGKGNLSLLVEPGSRVVQLIRLSKIDRIVSVRELKSANAS